MDQRPGGPPLDAGQADARPRPLARLSSHANPAGVAEAPSGTVRPAPGVERLTRLPAIELWSTDQALAAWLAANLDALEDATGVALSGGQLFEADPPVLMAERDGHPVVIVCQRGPATDAAFGSLLRHVAASGSHDGIWVCGEVVAEHGASISWLNRSIAGRFQMVRVSAARIGTSAPAAVFEQAIRAPRSSDGDAPADDATARRVAAGLARRAEDWVAEPPTAD